MNNKDASYGLRYTTNSVSEVIVNGKDIPLAMTYEQLYSEYIKYKELSEQLSAEIDVLRSIIYQPY